MEAPRSNRRVLTPFPPLEFHGELRPSQRDVVALACTKLASGVERRLQIAAPPGWMGRIKQKYANRHRNCQYVAESKR